MGKSKRNTKLFIVVSILVVLVVAIVALSLSQPSRKLYDVSVSKVEYDFPTLNVTLAFNEDVLEPINRLEVWYKQQKVGELEFTGIYFNEGDDLKATITLNAELPSNESMVLILFSGTLEVLRAEFQIPSLAL